MATRLGAASASSLNVIPPAGTAKSRLRVRREAVAAARAGPTARAAALLLVAACGSFAHAQMPPAPREIRAHFSCSGGKTIDATFVDGTPASVRLVLSDGRALSLPQALAASGARYANAGETIVFWNKGNTAFIEEGGNTTYAACATSR